MTIKALENLIGSLSKPSKMPCHGYSLPAHACRRGSLLRQIPGSVCSDCYALKNRYLFKNVQTALYKRLDAVVSDTPKWENLITQLIERKERSGYFRWHDSGDIQSIEHLNAINNVALSLPHIKFWLPTREAGTPDSMLDMWLKEHEKKLADNLVIRVSANMISQRPSSPTHWPLTITKSSVGLDGYHQCPAINQGNNCGSCRACWDSGVPVINYTQH